MVDAGGTRLSSAVVQRRVETLEDLKSESLVFIYRKFRPSRSKSGEAVWFAPCLFPVHPHHAASASSPMYASARKEILGCQGSDKATACCCARPARELRTNRDRLRSIIPLPRSSAAHSVLHLASWTSILLLLQHHSFTPHPRLAPPQDCQFISNLDKA